MKMISKPMLKFVVSYWHEDMLKAQLLQLFTAMLEQKRSLFQPSLIGQTIIQSRFTKIIKNF